MITITRNGKTTVYQGWQAWMLGAAGTVIVASAFMVIAVMMLGFAVTIGLFMLLAAPALVVVATLASFLQSKKAV